MGKWNFIRGLLTKMPETSERKEQLQLAAHVWRQESDTEVCKKLSFLHYTKKQLKKEEAENNLNIEALSVLLLERFEANDQESLRVKEVGLFSVKDSVYVALADEAKAFKWIRAKGLGSIIRKTVNARTLSSEVSAFLEQGKKLPDEQSNGIKIHHKQTIQYTPHKKGATPV